MVIKSFLGARDRPGSRLVIGLAVIDFSSSVLVPFVSIIIIAYDYKHWPLGQTGLLMTYPWTVSTYYASTWMLVAISLERAR